MARSVHRIEYPWYRVVNVDDGDSDELAQGDILEACPVFEPPSDLPADALGGESKIPFVCNSLDVVILSQSCDLQKAREKVEDVLLCVLWKRSDFSKGIFSKPSAWEDARKGRMPAFHILNRFEHEHLASEPRVVDFRRIHSLPVEFVREQAKRAPRIRLMPPYREHLSQAFARFFMRVGLPADIPPFTL